MLEPLHQASESLRRQYQHQTLADIGERGLIEGVLGPLVRSTSSAHVWDDCAEISTPGQLVISTDRVPWDLIGRVAGVIDEWGMGRHLAALNLSDLAAAGARPSQMLANFAFPGDSSVELLVSVVEGFLSECVEWGVDLIGGDLSESSEPQLVATAVGVLDGPMLYRSGAEPGDIIFVSRNPATAAAALLAFRTDIAKHMMLSPEDRRELGEALATPKPDFAAAKRLRGHARVSAMDNTDGLGISLAELATRSGVGLVVEAGWLPIPDVVRTVAALANLTPWEVAMGAGYNFALVGTCDRLPEGFLELGRVVSGAGVAVSSHGRTSALRVTGWDYWR